MLGKDIRIRLDEMAFVALHKLMIHHDAAEKDVSEQIKVLKERDKFFSENAFAAGTGEPTGETRPGEPQRPVGLYKRAPPELNLA
ncbi:hypothetical protein HPB50_016749 [Hyalomma asiaticum]|uniref:Uncharacterized protein n=1 Tax=Hyalomma asiaticum TaxID=266040 RepID=A0ACB7T1J5_HYAAI|nr:hypothetical protein HPB50_016749 [Hyalomma asiaticum]